MIKNYLNEIVFLLGSQRKKLPFMVILYVFASFLDVIGISFIIPFINLFSGNDNTSGVSANIYKIIRYIMPSFYGKNMIIIMGVLVLLIFILKTTISILINQINIKFSTKQDARLRLELMKKYQSIKYAIFTEKNTSDLIQRIRIHAGEYVYNCLIPMFRLVSESIICIIILLFLLYISPFAIILLGILLVLFFVFYDYFVRRPVNIAGEDGLKYSTEIAKNVQQALTGLKEIRVLKKEDFFNRKLENASILNAEAQRKYLTLTFMPRYVLELTIIFFMVFYPMILVFFNKDLSNIFSVLGLFGIAAIRIIPSVNVIFQSLTTLRYERPFVSLVYNDLKNLQIVEPSKSFGIEKPESNFVNFEAKNIFFKYNETTPWIINDLNFKINKGESIGIMGISGSGKTTLIDIILGLLEVNNGSLFLNDSPLNSFNLYLLHQQFAYLPQQIFLMDDTLRRNIALGEFDEEIDDERVMESIKSAKLLEFYNSLKFGLDSQLGENGIRISGGQRQRVALARAFYHNRELLVMDESTSALDSNTEKEIVENIQLLKGEKTLIIIAHRISTLKYCDKIFKLENGKLQLIENL